jgi:hypothetical protein
MRWMAFDPQLGSGKPNCSQPMSECGAPAPIAWQTRTAALHCKPPRVGDFTATSIFSMRCPVQKSGANICLSLPDAPELPVSFRPGIRQLSARGRHSAEQVCSSKADITVGSVTGRIGWIAAIRKATKNRRRRPHRSREPRGRSEADLREKQQSVRKENGCHQRCSII